MIAAVLTALLAVRKEIETKNENANYPDPVKVFLGGELRLLLAIEKVVLPFMVQRLKI